MRKIMACFIAFLATGCKENKPEEPKQQIVTGTYQSVKTDGISWADSLVMIYVDNAKNETIKAARKDTLEWMLDRTEKTDTATYLVFHIGHSFEQKFITDGWVYIDSTRRNIYEYDLPNDVLKSWHN